MLRWTAGEVNVNLSTPDEVSEHPHHLAGTAWRPFAYKTIGSEQVFRPLIERAVSVWITNETPGPTHTA
jgi:hypothetical protein